ncbi:MAG TPA: glycosyltransferase family 39 protein [Blastocatellia bacterium]|nr:glycosyltransferase family 39 protein [Blastocatellia bacterium]
MRDHDGSSPHNRSSAAANPDREPRQHRLDKLSLALIFLLLSASTVAWTLKNQTPPSWDPSDHISAGYDYYRTLAHLDFHGFYRELVAEPRYYAPLVHIATAAIFLVFGASRLSGIGANLISLALLLASVSWIFRRLYSRGESSRLSSVLPALLVACYHFPAWLLHDAFLDYPLMALVAASFALLIRADDFRNRRYALAFGAVAGLGALTKQTFPFFFILPALYVAARVIRSRDSRAILNLALAAIVTAGIAAVWYAPHFNDVIAIYRTNQIAALNENEAPMFSFRSNIFYFHTLIGTQTQLPFGLLFIAGLISSLARRRRESVMLYLWLLSGLLAFTLVANKDVRYTVPVLPAAALLSVCWLPGGRASGRVRARRVLKPAVAALIALWALAGFFNAQWPRDGSGYYIDTPEIRWMVLARNYYGTDHRPSNDDWGVPGIVRAVTQHAQLVNSVSQGGSARAPSPEETVSPTTRASSQAPTLGVVVNLPYLNPSSVALYARLMSSRRAGPPVITVDWVVVDSARDRLANCDYLLVRTGLDRAEWVAPMERYAEGLIRTNPSRFVRVASFPIPIDGAEAVLYKCGN